MKCSNKIIFYLYILLIFILSSLPGSSVEVIHVFGIDKIIHLVEYSILGFLFKYYIVRKRSIFNFQFYYILIVPVADEYFIQNISNRTVDYWDFIFNIIGLFLGILIRAYFDKKTYN